MPDTVRRVYKVTKANSGEKRLGDIAIRMWLQVNVHLHFASNMEWAENLTKRL